MRDQRGTLKPSAVWVRSTAPDSAASNVSSLVRLNSRSRGDEQNWAAIFVLQDQLSMGNDVRVTVAVHDAQREFAVVHDEQLLVRWLISALCFA